MGGQAELSSLPISIVPKMAQAMVTSLLKIPGAGVVSKLVMLNVNAIRWSIPKAQTCLAYARHEMMPPGPAEIPEIQHRMGKIVTSLKTGAYKNLKVNEAFLNAVVCLEVACWFFVGEIIGRRCIYGYDIPGCTYWELHI